LEKVDLIIKERRLRWLGHLLRMGDDRCGDKLYSETWETAKHKPGRPRKTGSTLYIRTKKPVV